MSSKIYVFIPADGSRCHWIEVNLQGHIASRHDGTVDALAQYLAGASSVRVEVLLPTDKVSKLSASTPNRRRETLQALPWQLEDQWSVPAEQLYCVIHPHKDNLFHIYAIDESYWQRWQQAFADNNINAHRWAVAELAPDRLPEQTGLCWQGQILWQEGEQTQSLALSHFPVWQGLHPDTAPNRLLASPDEAEQLSQDPAFAPINIETVDPVEHYLQLSGHLDLRWGLTQQRSTTGFNRWGAAAAAVLLMLGAYSGQLLWQQHHLSSQKAELETAINVQFKQLFPEVRRIINVRTQTEQQLLQLQSQSQSAGLLTALDPVSSLLSRPGLRFETLSYRNDPKQLRFLLQVENANQMEQLKTQLAKADISYQQSRPLQLALQLN